MPQVKLRLTAAVEASTMRTAFRPLVEAAQQARAQVKSILAGIDGDLARIGRAAGRAGGGTGTGAGAGRGRGLGGGAPMQGPLQMQQKTWAQIEREQEAHERRLERIAERAARRRDAAREQEHREILSQARRDQNLADRDSRALDRAVGRANRADARSREGSVRSFGTSLAQTTTGLVSRGVGVASDLARGVGIDFSMATGVRRRTELEAAAAGLVNSGYQQGKEGPAGQMQDRRAVMSDIQRVGETYGINQGDVAAGLGSFVGKTGELQTGRDMLDAMAKTAKATGAEFNDVAAAAGAISNKLGEVGEGKDFATAADKAKAINRVLMALAGQGKEGAVEIKDLATQMEKLTSQASKFKSNADLVKMTGTGTGANIAMLGVLAQAARKTEKGTAAQATQSAMAFVRDLTGQTALKRIGADTIYTDKGRTTLRDPQEIVKDILSKTKGDQSKLAYLMSNQNSRAVVNSFLDPYMKAYKGTSGSAEKKDAAGRAAVDEAFKTLKDATLNDKTQAVALGEALETTATKAEQFQQKLDRVVGDMADKVIPAMLKLAPDALDAASAMANVATWASSNPASAGGAIVAASVAKAVADTLATRAAEKGIELGGKLIGAVGGGTAAAAMIGTMVVASVGMMAIQEVLSDQKKGQEISDNETADATNAFAELRAAKRAYDTEAVTTGVPSAEAAKRLEEARAKAEAQQAALTARMDEGLAIKEGVRPTTSLPEAALNSAFGTDYFGSGQNMVQREAAIASSEKLELMSEQIRDLATALKGGTLDVRVTNMPGPGAPLLTGSGQTGVGE